MRTEEARPPAPTRDGHVSITHIPALDGLRGAAVAGVLLYHAGHLDGGYLGVDLFFVLSGFLITSLLLAEHDRTGGVSLGTFWGRRMRRLLPGLFGMLLGVGAYAVVVARSIDLPGIRADAIATLLYAANWRTIVEGSSYWDISLAPSPLQHTWSLAIEEQFYVLWPLVFFLIAGRAARRGGSRASLADLVLRISVVGACVSAGLLAALHAAGASDTRVYEGTDTRAAAILLGIALAAWRARRGDRAGATELLRGRVADVVGVAAVAGLAVLWVQLEGESPWLFRGGLALASLLGMVAIATASGSQPTVVGRAFSWRPLRALGAISYGLYLWHWPIYLVVDHRNGRLPLLGDTVLGGWTLTAVKIAASLVVAAASYWVIEQPIRRQRVVLRPGWAWAVGTGIAIALVVVAATRGGVDADRIEQQPERASVSVAGAPDVFVAGDSVGLSVASRLYADPERYGVNPYDRTRIGCSIVEVGREAQNFAGNPKEPVSCPRYAMRAIDEVRPDVFFLLIGSRPNDYIRLDGAWVRACDPAYDAEYERATAAFLRKVQATGAEAVMGTILRSGSASVPVEGADDRVACINRIIERMPTVVPGVHVVDTNELLCPDPDGPCLEELEGDPVRTDGLHFDRGPGGDRVVDWIVDRIFDQVDVERPDPERPAD